MIVYGSSLSPFVRKVVVFAAEKGLELESRPASPRDPAPDFLECSPFAKIPGFRDGEFTISDSSAIVHYLEAVAPAPELIPTSPRERARTIWFDEFGDTILAAAGTKIFFNRFILPRFMGQQGDLSAANLAEREELPRAFEYLEKQIPESGYLVGDRFTLADIAVVSPIATLKHIDCRVDENRFPKVASYSERICKRSSFAKAIEAEMQFIASLG